MKLFRKKASPKQVAKEIYQILTVSEQPTTYFTLERTQPDIFDCKIGGAYYVEDNQKIPRDKVTNNPLFLLAQINFSKLTPLLNFPTRGLLQIFISGDDDLYGCDFDAPTKQSRFVVRYLETLPQEVALQNIIKLAGNEETMLPFLATSEYLLVAHETKQMITLGDYRIDSYVPQCKKYLTGDKKSFYDLDEEVYEILQDMIKNYACQIGGYPCFTQWDPRQNMSEPPTVLLFQLDTVEDIMWGDSGVANFFISEDDLKQKDFSRVLYNWDCC